MTLLELERLCTRSGCIGRLWERLLGGCREDSSAGRRVLEIGGTLLDAHDETLVGGAAGRRDFGAVITRGVVRAGTGPAVFGFGSLVLALSVGCLASPAVVGGHAEMRVGLGALVAEMRAAVSGALKSIGGLVATRSLVVGCCSVFFGSIAFIVGRCIPAALAGGSSIGRHHETRIEAAAGATEPGRRAPACELRRGARRGEAVAVRRTTSRRGRHVALTTLDDVMASDAIGRVHVQLAAKSSRCVRDGDGWIECL